NGQPILVTHRWGKTYLIQGEKGGAIQTRIIRTPDNEKLGNLYNAKKEEAYPKGTAADTKKVLALADWCLQHGMLKEFAEVMDKFSKDDPAHAAAKAYSQVKSELAKPLPNPKADSSRSALLGELHSATTDHYIAYYNRNEEPPEVKSRLVR